MGISRQLNKCLDNACDYVEKQSYVQAIHSQCRFCKLKMLYMFKTFVSLLSVYASYQTYTNTILAEENVFSPLWKKKECLSVRTQNNVRWILTVTFTEKLKSTFLNILWQRATSVIVCCFSDRTWKNNSTCYKKLPQLAWNFYNTSICTFYECDCRPLNTNWPAVGRRPVT